MIEDHSEDFGKKKLLFYISVHLPSDKRTVCLENQLFEKRDELSNEMGHLKHSYTTLPEGTALWLAGNPIFSSTIFAAINI